MGREQLRYVQALVLHIDEAMAKATHPPVLPFEALTLAYHQLSPHVQARAATRYARFVDALATQGSMSLYTRAMHIQFLVDLVIHSGFAVHEVLEPPGARYSTCGARNLAAAWASMVAAVERAVVRRSSAATDAEFAHEAATTSPVAAQARSVGTATECIAFKPPRRLWHRLPRNTQWVAASTAVAAVACVALWLWPRTDIAHPIPAPAKPKTKELFHINDSVQVGSLVVVLSHGEDLGSLRRLYAHLINATEQSLFAHLAPGDDDDDDMEAGTYDDDDDDDDVDMNDDPVVNDPVVSDDDSTAVGTKYTVPAHSTQHRVIHVPQRSGPQSLTVKVKGYKKGRIRFSRP